MKRKLPCAVHGLQSHHCMGHNMVIMGAGQHVKLQPGSPACSLAHTYQRVEGDV